MTTHRIANIVVASTNTTLRKEFSAKLGEENLNVLTSDGSDLDEKAKNAHPDLIVIDVDSDGFDGFAATNAIKSDENISHIPVVIMAKEKTEELYLKAIDVKADDIFIHAFDIKEFIIHIRPLLRLSTMFAELDKRVALAKKFKVPASSVLYGDDSAPYNILLINPKAGDKATLETVLEGNCNIETCDDFFEAEDMLSGGRYDACVTHIDDETMESVLSLSSRVRNNPRLFNLPVIVLSEGAIADRMDAYRRGVTRICRRPLTQSSLKAKVLMLVRRQRLRWNIRNALETTRDDNTVDDLTNSYNKDFFLQHLEEQVSSAHKWQKHLSVIFFSIPNIPSVKKQFGDQAGNHLLQQVHQWIAGLTRIEDMVARFDDQEFCITLPDTPQEEAQIVMHRIAGILSYTDFAIPDVFQPLSVWVEVGITSLDLGDEAPQLIERARKHID